MEFSPKTKTVQSFARDVKNGTINMHHKLQRQEGLWNTRAKQNLSILFCGRFRSILFE